MDAAIALAKDIISAAVPVILAWIGYLSIMAKFQITALKGRVSFLETEQAKCHKDREELRSERDELKEVLADKFPSDGIILEAARAKVREKGLPNTNSNVLNMFRQLQAEHGAGGAS